MNIYIDILKSEKPDLIIGDTNLLIGTAAKSLGLPVVQLVRKGFHPRNPELIWWDASASSIRPPEVKNMFNQVLIELGQSEIQRVEQLLNGDLLIVPSVPVLEPIAAAEDTFYIGPLLHNSKSTSGFFKKKNPQKPLIYITIGAGAGTVGSQKFFTTVKNALSNKAFDVVVATTPKYYRSSLNHLSDNIRFEAWVNGRAQIYEADLVIFHGGYGTMMETIDAGVPSIVIPFHSEQESNGRRLQDQGCAKLLNLSRQKEIVMQKTWHNSNYSYACKWDYDLNHAILYDTVNMMLTNQKFKSATNILQQKSMKYRGAEQLFELVNTELGVI